MALDGACARIGGQASNRAPHDGFRSAAVGARALKYVHPTQNAPKIGAAGARSRSGAASREATLHCPRSDRSRACLWARRTVLVVSKMLNEFKAGTAVKPVNFGKSERRKTWV